MKLPAPAGCVLLLAVLAACASGPDPEPGPGAASPDAAAAPSEAPGNLLRTPDRAKLYFDLEQMSLRYMDARDRGAVGTWESLHANVLGPLVDENRDELLATLGREGERSFRRIAARGLGFGSDAGRIVPALMPVLADRDEVLVAGALVSLYLLEDARTPVRPLVELLNHPDLDIRSNAALALARVLRARRIEGLGPDEEVKRASGHLVLLVSSVAEDEFVRAHAAAALGAIGDPAATDILTNLLGDASSAVRMRAAEGLGVLAQEQAVLPLIDALHAAPTPTEDRVVIAALTRIARSAGYPCDPEALGTSAENWRNWYLAVRR